MDFGGANYLAIIGAAVAAFFFGAAWYGALSKPWVRAVRLDQTTLKMTPMHLATSIVAELVMAWVLAGVIWHIGAGQPTLRIGIVCALFVWLGFVATTTAVNQRYEGYGWDLTLIDWGHWLGVLLIMGAIIGWLG